MDAGPADNNHIEMQIRPVAIGKANWLFADSLRAGKRAAAIMSLIQSAKLNGLNPYAYLRDVLERLPTHPDNRIDELLPHNWTGSVTAETLGRTDSWRSRSALSLCTKPHA